MLKDIEHIDATAYMAIRQQGFNKAGNRTVDIVLNIRDLYTINSNPDETELRDAKYYITTDSGYKARGRAKNFQIDAPKVQYAQIYYVGILVKSPIWLTCSEENGCNILDDQSKWPKVDIH